MKTRKLLDSLHEFLDADRRQQEKERKSLKKLLRGLKHKKQELERRCNDCDDDGECEKLTKKLEVIRAQRQKGVRLLRELKN